MCSAEESAATSSPDRARLAAIFATQRSWLVWTAVPAYGVVARLGGLVAICGAYDGSIVLPIGRAASRTALDAAFTALGACAPAGGVLVWSATGDEPLRMTLSRRLFARGCDLAFRPRWMWCDLAAETEVDHAARTAPPGIEVRLATADDAATIAASDAAGTPYASQQEAALIIAHGRRPARRQHTWLLLAREDGGRGPVVGQVVLHRGRAGMGGIFSMGVHPSVQRRGVGTALLHAAAALARARGLTALGLNATPEGEQLYRRCGFEIVGDGQTWHLPSARLAPMPSPESIRLAEAIADGDIAALGQRLGAHALTSPLPNGDTPLALAARTGQAHVARWLLAHGAPPAVIPLWTLGWHAEVAALLCDPALLNQPAGPDHLTPLHEAIMRDDHELVRLLLAAGADLTAVDTRYHGTPLGWARALNRVELVLLLEANAKG